MQSGNGFKWIHFGENINDKPSKPFEPPSPCAPFREKEMATGERGGYESFVCVKEQQNDLKEMRQSHVPWRNVLCLLFSSSFSSLSPPQAVINSTITPNMTFTKTSQKFGQWSDVRANTVYGLGFPSEAELNKVKKKKKKERQRSAFVSRMMMMLWRRWRKTFPSLSSTTAR